MHCRNRWGQLAFLVLACSVSWGATWGGAAGEPSRFASSGFWKHWGDGRAEVSGYALKTTRYGQSRDGELVLIYVTEPMDRRTWIKDDRGQVADGHRVNVLKLNHVVKFRTGIYPYSVMTSVFAPVDGLFPERFDPAKITLTAQEWCGHVYHQLRRSDGGFDEEIRSYFSAEGERDARRKTPPGALYEDALLIQLRELDGPFNEGERWEGPLVPGLWSVRKAHRELAPVAATIERSAARRGELAVTRFTVRREGFTWTLDVENRPPRRVLGWSTSDGEEASLLGTERLPYWQLNGSGDESHLKKIGLGAE